MARRWQYLSRLADLGITVIEVMPIGAFPGRFGWGYDGVYWFAPTAQYGTPDDFRAFVNRAHSLSIGVILDVVYNHLGPEGNYLREFSTHYFSDRVTEWGDALDFDGPNSAAVREMVIENARYWIEDFHLDGLRLDATQQIFDRSEDHIVKALTREARLAAKHRNIIVVAENEPNNANLVRPLEKQGFGLDELWNDDFHHSASVALTGRNEAYYSGFFGKPQEFISAVKYTSLYQGQLYYWQKGRRGKPGLDISPANNPGSARVRNFSHPGLYRAMTALMLLSPGTPMLFQGQEYGARTPFNYFADLEPDLSRKVCAGRLEFLTQFPRTATPEGQRQIPDPSSLLTFEQSKLNRNETDDGMVALHRDLLSLRRIDKAFKCQEYGAVDGAVLADNALVLRFFIDGINDRLLVLNLGSDLLIPSLPEPLLASPSEEGWQELWTSEDPKYGGAGTPSVEPTEGWRIPAYSAVLLLLDDLNKQGTEANIGLRAIRTMVPPTSNTKNAPTSRSNGTEGVLTRERVLVLALIIATLLALYVCFLIIRPFIPSIAFALALAVATRRPYVWLKQRVSSDTLAAAIAAMLVLLLIIVPIFYLGAYLVQNAVHSIEELRRSNGDSDWRGIVEQQPMLAAILHWAEANLNLETHLARVGETFAGQAANILKGSANLITQLGITLFVLFFMYRDCNSGLDALYRLVPLSRSEANRMFNQVILTLRATVNGSLTVGIIQALLAGIMYGSLGVPGSLIWAASTFFAALIPVFGTALIWGPIVIYLAILGGWGKALILLAWGCLAIAMIDNFLYPFLVGDQLRLHTVPTFFSIVGGIALFGASGLVLGPMTLAITIGLIDVWWYRTTEGQAAEKESASTTGSSLPPRGDIA